MGIVPSQEGCCLVVVAYALYFEISVTYTKQGVELLCYVNLKKDMAVLLAISVDNCSPTVESGKQDKNVSDWPRLCKNVPLAIITLIQRYEDGYEAFHRRRGPQPEHIIS